MKKLILVGVLVFSNFAMAGLVERVLPSDAHNVRLAGSVVTWMGVGSKVVFNSASEGPVSETIFAKRFVVVVKYDSKDTSDVNKTGSGLDGQILATDDQTPTVTFVFELSPTLLAAVEAGKISGDSLVSLKSGWSSVVVDDPNFRSNCRYSFEYNIKEDPNCPDTPNKVKAVRKVLVLQVSDR